MRVLILALVLVGCADATQNAGGTDPEPMGDIDLALPDPVITDLSGVIQDIPAASRKVGEDCQKDEDCTSSLCKPVLPGGGQVCVATCTSQADCTGFINLFCAPITVGSPDGYCIPRSPAHCASCGADSECGGLTEACMTAPSDISAACHIDCALAGAAACPGDYSCNEITYQGKTRKLCVPKNQVCLDALGGHCERVGLPQACSRTTVAGTCRGERTCLGLPLGRYSTCGAAGPQYKNSCTELDQPKCNQNVSPAVLNQPASCGACGSPCPGLGQPTSDALCVDPSTKKCDLTCRGENYDVDKNPANGCERIHATPPGHTQPTAAGRGSKDCNDGASRDVFSTGLYSDSRTHNPAITSFSGTVGSAPDYWVVNADGGFFCVNDVVATFSTGGGGATPCYRLTITTNKKAASIDVTGSGSGSYDFGSGSYNGGGQVFFKIEKFCNLPVQEAVTYTVDYHL